MSTPPSVKKKININMKQDSGRSLHGCCILQVRNVIFKKYPGGLGRKGSAVSSEPIYSSGAHVWRGKAFLSLKSLLNNCKAANLFYIR